MMLVPVPIENSSLPPTPSNSKSPSSASSNKINPVKSINEPTKLPGKMVLKVDSDDEGDDNNTDNIDNNTNKTGGTVPTKYRPPTHRVKNNTTIQASNTGNSHHVDNQTYSKPRSRGNSFDRGGRGGANRSRASSYDHDHHHGGGNRAVPIDKKVQNPKPVMQLSPNSMEKAIASTTFELHLGNSPSNKESKGNPNNSNNNNSNKTAHSGFSKKTPSRNIHHQQQQIVQPYEVEKQNKSSSTSSSTGGSVGSVFTNLKTGDKKKSIYKISTDS